MTKGRLQSIVAEYRQQLARHEAHAEHTLESAYKRALVPIQHELERLYKQIDAVQQSGDAVPLSWLYEEKRLQTIKTLVQSQIDHFGGFTQSVVGQGQRMGVALGHLSAQQQMQTLLERISHTFGIPNTKAINDLVSALQPGSPLDHLFSTFGAQSADSVGQALITGITLGQGPRMVASAIEQALGITRARALTISRTEMLRAYRSSALENYRANSDVVGQWRWNCDFSARTCAACLAMDGTLHSLDEEMESHVNCRCSASPVTKSWSDLLDDAGIDLSGLDELEPDEPQTGDQWFSDQPSAIQQQVLGNKYSGWKNGDFTLKDMVGRAHSADWGGSVYEKSLKQLTGGK